jgi:hypothetical protein
MDYTYSNDYGSRGNSKWTKSQHEWDKAVDKGLAQNSKEEKLPFFKLLAKIRHESEVEAAQTRRFCFMRPVARYGYSWSPNGQVFLKGTQVNLANYWIDRLRS